MMESREEDFPTMRNPSGPGHALESSASTIWTLLFLAYSSSTFVSEFGHGWPASWTILFVLVPVILTGSANILAAKRHAVAILLSYVAYIIIPALLQLTKPHGVDNSTSRAQVFDLVTVLAIWLPLEFKLLSPKLSPTGLVSAWGPLTAALNIVNIFTVLRPFAKQEFARELGYTFKFAVKDVPISIVFAALYILAAIPLATSTKFGKLKRRIQLLQTPEREVAVFFGMYFNGLADELLFRGLIQNMIEQQTSSTSVFALVVAALAYACAHLSKEKLGFSRPNYRYAICTFVSGLCCGMTYRMTSKVTASAITHAVANYALYRLLLADCVDV